VQAWRLPAVIKPWQMRQRYGLPMKTTIAQQCAENQLTVLCGVFTASPPLPGRVSGVGARGLMQIMPDTPIAGLAMECGF
jgi:hypothetical protein